MISRFLEITRGHCNILILFVVVCSILLIGGSYAETLIYSKEIKYKDESVENALIDLKSEIDKKIDEARYECPAGKACSISTPPDFATNSWSVIKAYAMTNPSAYPVGATRCVKVEGFTSPSENGCSNGEFKVRVANNTTTSECSTPGFSQTACGFVVEFVDIITTYLMNTSDTNVGGWPATAMRTYVNSTIYNALPNDLKSIIIGTNVISSHGLTEGENNFTSTDKLYLLAVREVWSDKYSYDSAYDNTRQLDYYANLGVVSTDFTKRQAAIKKNSGNSAYYWWLRAAFSSTTVSFLSVTTDGSRGDYFASADISYGVSPAFRIG